MEDILTKFAQKNLGMDGPVSKEEIEEFLKEYQIPPEVIASLPHAIK